MRQAIRSSLRGKARSSLLTLPTDATPEQIVQKLEDIYGNIYPTEKLLQQFYAATQEKGESVADYGMRLENLLQTCIDRGSISLGARDDMLTTKLWSGLSDSNLRNASRYKYDTIDDFEALRMELRTIELDLKHATQQNSSSDTSSCVPVDKKKSQVSQIGNTRGDPSLEAILKKLDGMDQRIREVEREVKRSHESGRSANQFALPAQDEGFRNFDYRGRSSNRSVHTQGFRNFRGGQRGGSRGRFAYDKGESFRGNSFRGG